MFSQKDLESIQEKGLSAEILEKQIAVFKQGFTPVNLVNPATIKKGITSFSEARIKEHMKRYNKSLNDQKIVKFVPASGAATRMFKRIFELRNSYRGTPEDILELMTDRGAESIYYFIENLGHLPFYGEMLDSLEKRGENIEEVLEKKKFEKIINSLISEDKGIGYGNYPKGLIKFHRYADEIRTALEEHLIEGVHYCTSGENEVHIHLTVSENFKKDFQEFINKIIDKYEERYSVKFNIELSVQKPSTDTLAVDPDNKPYRAEDGQLLFRPGGHGSLIQNLNEIDADLIFIKNIDNVPIDRLKEDTSIYKKVIGGYLLCLKNRIFGIMRNIQRKKPTLAEMADHVDFMRKRLNIIPPDNFDELSKGEKTDFIINKLNRPIRVCGMVENEGEPGGGPFWVKDNNGNLSLQIIESSQVNHDNEEQRLCWESSTHFNPVDIVCSIKDYRDHKYDLNDFIDQKTYFISEKSVNGDAIKALEHPGLWNGAMADWITVFVEVPIETFNPVKTINDLLREEHQNPELRPIK